MFPLFRFFRKQKTTRTVIVSIRERVNGSYQIMVKGAAELHGFSTEDGSCVAIVEWPDGQVETVYAGLIKFAKPTA